MDSFRASLIGARRTGTRSIDSAALQKWISGPLYAVSTIPNIEKRTPTLPGMNSCRRHGVEPLHCLGAARRQSHLKKLCAEASRRSEAKRSEALGNFGPVDIGEVARYRKQAGVHGSSRGRHRLNTRKLKMWKTITAAFVLAAASMHASAICLNAAPTNTNDAYSYYIALTGALHTVKTARDETILAAAKVTGPQFSPADMLTSLKLARADYICAQQAVDGYGKSTNKGIAVSALGVSAALTSLAQQEGRLEQYVTDGLNGKPEAEGTRAQTLSDINVEFDNSWQTLMVGVASSSQAVPHYNSSDRVDGVTLSAQQRADVIRRLRAFGPAVEHGADNLPLEASIAILLEFFRNKQLKSFG